jgi:uncharacterized protein YigE (DUF2233 family)
LDTAITSQTSTQDSVQAVINRNISLLDQYDENLYWIEHKALLINDTINESNLKYETAIEDLDAGLEKILLGVKFDSLQQRVKNFKDIRKSLEKNFDDAWENQEQLKILDEKLKNAKTEQKNYEASLKKIEAAHANVLDSIYNIIDRDTANACYEYTYRGVKYLVFIADNKSQDVRINNNGTKSLQPLQKTWVQLKGKKPVAVMNAGMFERDGSAKGLLIVDGKVIHAIDATTKKIPDQNFYLYPNGVFYIDSLGRYFVEETQSFLSKFSLSNYKNIQFATQSGPMLLNKGKGNPHFGFRSVNRNIRNAVGVLSRAKGSKVAFVISKSPCTFQEITSFYRDILGCTNALYLDGAISEMYVEWKGIKFGDLGGSLGPTISISNKK